MLVVGALFGETAGLAAVGGAVCASLPDLPNPPQRVLPRVLPAAGCGGRRDAARRPDGPLARR